MDKVRYFFAAGYQSIKKRRPDGTPYFNLSLIVTSILLLNIFSLLLTLKIWFNVNLIADTKQSFIFAFISIAVFIGFIIRITVPLDDIIDIDVKPKSIKNIGAIFILAYVVSFILIAILIKLNS
jgi:NADH:ubiquinone oxidoreductase subunit 6 (subunit J)